MKRTTAIVAILALAAGFGLGRVTAPPPDSDLSTVASFRRALDDPDWLTRSYRLSGFLKDLSPENLSGAVEALESRLPWLSTDELRLFMLAWSRFDAPGALEHALSWPRQFSRNGSGAAIYAWAFRNPAAALYALNSVESAQLREFMEGRLIAGWVHGEHKQSANEYIASLSEGPRRFSYVGMLAWELSKQGPEAVMRWAEGVPDDSARYKAAVFLKATSTLAGSDPPGTARWLADHLDRPYADGVLRVVARSWATSDPAAAMNWATGLPAGEKRDGTVSNAFGVWLERSPLDAELWLRSATPAPALDPAVRVIARRHQRQSPALAMEWAMAISDPQLRQRVVTNLGRAWLRRDADAARVWLAESDLSEEVLDAIRDSAQPSEGSGEPGLESEAAGGESASSAAP